MEEEQIEQIKKETRKLLEEFSKALASVKTDEESNVEREIDRREERQDSNESVYGADFRRIMFENAPQKDEDLLIAEKKTW